MQFQNENGQDIENIEQMLDDLGLTDQNCQIELAKKDSTMFMIDCSLEIMQIFQGQSKCELQKIFQGYSNFLQSKIMASAGDKVGLMLYNVQKKKNDLEFNNIYMVRDLHDPDAQTTKQASILFKKFNQFFGGISENKASLHYALWLYNNSIKDLSSHKFHLRLFLFTADDCPHQVGDQRRQQSIHYARQLGSKGVQIELFPIRKAVKCSFDIRLFYQQIITLDADQINSTVLDNSSKILDLQTRLRQKQFKKRTLNRLLMKIGKQTEIGVKIYSMYTKAKKPFAKKVDAKSNKLLQRITKKMNKKGQILFDTQIGTYYPLGGQKICINKADINKIKNLQQPGLTLLGFKPNNLIKPYHNLRTSYFVYPDEQHVIGSNQFCDALINQMVKSLLVGIVKIVPRNNQQLRFAALIPQLQKIDDEQHSQTPPGFNMIILPYAQDFVNFVGDKTQNSPTTVSFQLLQISKLFINNLTIQNFDLRNFENPALQKFYTHLQAIALNENEVDVRPDLLMPDEQGFKMFSDVVELVKQTVKYDVEGTVMKKQQDGIDKQQQQDKKLKKQEQQQDASKDHKNYFKKSHYNGNNGNKTKKQQIEMKVENDQNIINLIEQMINKKQFKNIKVNELKQYLKLKSLNDKGKKEELLDRVVTYLSSRDSNKI